MNQFFAGGMFLTSGGLNSIIVSAIFCILSMAAETSGEPDVITLLAKDGIK